MVAISRHQASTHPDVPWTIIHNGLTLDGAPFVEQPGEELCFVGRIDPEKGVVEAMDVAQRAGRRIRIAAKVGNMAGQRDYYENVFRPALGEGRIVRRVPRRAQAARSATSCSRSATRR